MDWLRNHKIWRKHPLLQIKAEGGLILNIPLGVGPERDWLPSSQIHLADPVGSDSSSNHLDTHSFPGRWLPTLYPLWGGKHLSAPTYGTTPYHSPPYGVNHSHPVDGVVFRDRIQPDFVLLVIIAGSFISNITISTTGTDCINYPDQRNSPWEGFMDIMDYGWTPQWRDINMVL